MAAGAESPEAMRGACSEFASSSSSFLRSGFEASLDGAGVGSGVAGGGGGVGRGVGKGICASSGAWI